jgi:hypothetical protein
MERVRFLRAGLVTPLPGGPGIDPAGIMTGARGASLYLPSMARVTPASSRWHEARPGLSDGINLRRKRRGGAPRGERASPSPPSRACGRGRRGAQGAQPRFASADMDGAPVGAPPPLGWGEERIKQNSGADASRERFVLLISSPACGGGGERSDARGGKCSTLAQALRPQAPSLPSPASGRGKEMPPPPLRFAPRGRMTSYTESG